MEQYEDAVGNMEICPLSALKEGEWARIQTMDTARPLAERLGDIGLHAGVLLTCVRKSFLGDPVAYGIDGSDTVVAIRRQDAEGILVSVMPTIERAWPWD